jgi:protein-arginine kinase activator protein McsA
MNLSFLVIEGNDFLFLENMDNLSKEEGQEDIDTSLPGTAFSSLTIEELNQKLQEAILEEAYEKAARIRDELNKRNSSQ